MRILCSKLYFDNIVLTNGFILIEYCVNIYVNKI